MVLKQAKCSFIVFLTENDQYLFDHVGTTN